MSISDTSPSSGPVRQLRVVLEVDDYDAALAYYRDVLGMASLAAYAEGRPGEDDRVAILDAGTATLELATRDHGASVDRLEGLGERRGPRLRLAFEVADAEVSTADSLRAGAVEVAPPTPTPWGSLNSRLQAPGDQQITLFEERGR